jgi:type I restriction enzyme, R subunit
MTPFNEENTVEQMVLDTLCDGIDKDLAAERHESYGDKVKGWRFVSADDLPCNYKAVMVESMVVDALLRLNPEIKAQPERADEVLYRLRTIPLSAQSEGLVRANELFSEWLKGEKQSMGLSGKRGQPSFRYRSSF